MYLCIGVTSFKVASKLHSEPSSYSDPKTSFVPLLVFGSSVGASQWQNIFSRVEGMLAHNQWKFTSHSSGGWKSRSRSQHGHALGKDLFQEEDFSLCPHIAEGQETNLWGLFYKGTHTLLWGLCPHPLVSSQIPHLLIYHLYVLSR